ncbi:hypothetical protein ACMA5I_06380 [Paracoccaceae bacterium GXU_MW_L88]
MDQGSACPVVASDAMKHLELSSVPVFVGDLTARKCVWANAATLRILGDISLEEYRAQSFESMAEIYLPSLDAEVAKMRETGAPIRRNHAVIIGYRHYSFHLQMMLVQLENGNEGIIVEARHDRDSRRDYVRAKEAMDQIPAVVTATLIDRQQVYANRAAVVAYGEDPPLLPGRMCDPDEGQALQEVIMNGGYWHGIAKMRTLRGERWHAITVSEAQDSISGLPIYVICETDLTEAITDLPSHFLEMEKTAL